MKENYKSKLFVGLIITGLLFGCAYLYFSDAPIAAAKTKTKWQKLLERNEAAVSLWQKYLPKMTKDGYQKVTKQYLALFAKLQTAPSVGSNENYPLHQNINTTYFWVGEKASSDNKNISNSPSAWDGKWVQHFGGVDDPVKRGSNFFPAAFTPKENPFYFALPYNDFAENGKRKSEAKKIIPWANEKNWGSKESMCKNQWIKIMKGGKVAYAQWEDVGPFNEDDSAYVYGTAQPKSKTNDHAGLDVSPAVRDYLGLGDVDKTSWQFVDAKDVPAGPWKKIITTSQIYWN